VRTPEAEVLLTLSKYFGKRKHVCQTSSWEDRESGTKKYRTEIVARDMVLLGSHENGSSDDLAQSKRQPA
jgi:hypothetical protein